MSAAPVRARTGRMGVALAARAIGATLLAATATIHFHLWADGYRGIAWIGPLFLAVVALSAALALALLTIPARWVPWTCAAGALLEAGTLGGLLLSVSVGFLGFTESWSAPLTATSVVVQGAGATVLGAFAATEFARSRRQRPDLRT